MPERTRNHEHMPFATADGIEGVRALPVDPESAWLTLLATGTSSLDACTQLWNSGDPHCREFALSQAREVLAKEAGRRDTRVNYPKTCLDSALKELTDLDPEFGNAVFSSMEGLPLLSLEMKGCNNLKGFPKGMTALALEIDGAKSLDALPEGFRTQCGLKLSGCPSLANLPKGLVVGQGLEVRDCDGLTGFPQGLEVGMRASVHGCRSFSEIPADVRLREDVSIYECPVLVGFPDGFEVGRDLDIADCNDFRRLPKGLKVHGDLWIDRCPSWDGIIPEDAEIVGKIHKERFTGRDGISLAQWRKQFGTGSCFR